MWTKRNDHVPKSGCVFFFNIRIGRAILKKKKKPSLTIRLASFVFSWLLILFSLVFTLNFSNHGRSRREDEEPYFALRIIQIFVYAFEACCGHLSIAFARKMREICNFEVALWEYGAYERSIWNQEWMYIFGDRLLLGLWMEKKKLRSEIEWNAIHSYFCLRGWSSIWRKKSPWFRVIVPV